MGSSCHCVAALRLLMLLLVLITMAVPGALGQGTRVGFYLTSCPRAETIVRSTVQTHYRADPTVAPGLLRMHFHDCFVRGCDASILISGSSTERNALPNLNLRGFNVIDDAKAQVEAACPGVVSCADILALAARDSVVLAGGPSWLVPTGRRDGRVSVASDANDLPAFTDSIQEQIRKFRQFNLTVQDLVTLVGGHTIGTSQCQFFRYRLYNFTSDGRPDQTIVASFLPQLRTLCPADGDGTRRVALDNGSGGNFDDSFFRNLRDGRGVLESDQMLFSDPSTRRFIQAYTGLLGGLVGAFGAEFAASMVRMSNIGVNTGTAGEIRTVCAAINS